MTDPDKQKASGSGRLVNRYRATLAGISARTGTALPSLITSFAILHEATALAPLVVFFYAAKAAGVGERVVGAVRTADKRQAEDAWLRRKGEQWVDEGERWVGRVGRRYGIWGFEKGAHPPAYEERALEDAASRRIAGDVANAVLAYGVTKVPSARHHRCARSTELCVVQALLPLRIGLSLYLAPAFARGVVDPLASSVLRTFRRK